MVRERTMARRGARPHGVRVVQAQIAARMRRLEPVEMRLELKAGINRCKLVNDFYNNDLSISKYIFRKFAKTLVFCGLFCYDAKDEKYIYRFRQITRANF